VSLTSDEAPREFTRRLKTFCSERLADYKVPVKVAVTSKGQHTERFKKSRRQSPVSS